jgi:hypothetical protein
MPFLHSWPFFRLFSSLLPIGTPLAQSSGRNEWIQTIRLAVQIYKQTKTNSMAFGPQVNHTDSGTATGRRILVPTFVDRGVSCGQRAGTPTAVSLSFLDRSRYFFFQVSHLSSRSWMDSIPAPLLFRISGSAGNQTRDFWVCSQELWPLDHIVQMYRSVSSITGSITNSTVETNREQY